MTNTEKNRLIEAFMGWELKYITDYDLNQWCFVNKYTGKTISGMYNNSELPYCTDWNWLIEAARFFDCLKFKDNNIGKRLKYYKLCENIGVAIAEKYNIDDAANALCEGIEWYNSLKND